MTGLMPTALEMERALARRHGPKAQDRLAAARMAVLGLGGLGSAVALCLARMGMGRLLLVDHDRVELVNIHRQHYFVDQVGRPKAQALRETILRVNPFVLVEARQERLDGAAIAALCPCCDVVIECFDDAEMKAEALRAARGSMPRRGYVGASGVAGLGPTDSLTCRVPAPGVVIVGDGESEAEAEGGLMASRVGVAAHMQAHAAIRLLLELGDAA